MTLLPHIGHTTLPDTETPALRAAISPSPGGAPPASPRPGTHRPPLLGETGMAARSADREPASPPAREKKERILVEAAGAPPFRAHPMDVPGPGDGGASQHDPAGPPRFIVQSTTGHDTHVGRGPATTEWLVCDRLDAMRVVWRSHAIDETGREHVLHHGPQETIARTIAARFERATR